MKDQQPEQIQNEQQPPDLLRARTGTSAASVKAALLLVLVGLLPAFSATFFLRAPYSSLQKANSQTVKDLDQLLSFTKKLNKKYLDSENKVLSLERELAEQKYISSRNTKFSKTCNSLRSAISKLTEEQVPQDTSIAKIIKDAPFAQLLLIQKSTGTIVLSKTEKKAGKIGKIFPALANLMETPSKETITPSKADQWILSDLGLSTYTVAAKSNPPSFLTPTAKDEKTPPVPEISLAFLEQATGELDSTLLVFWWALPLFAILLALAAFAWFANSVFAPLNLLTSSAVTILQEPGFCDPELAKRSGVAQDLAMSLIRVDQRLMRLGDLEKKFDTMGKELASMAATLKLAAGGMLKTRISTSSVEFQEISHSMNEVLESISGKIASIHKATALVREASHSLEPVLHHLSASMDIKDPSLLPDISHMGKLLGVYTQDLCASADSINKLILGEAPGEFDQEQLDEFKANIQGTQNGIQLIRENIEGVLSSIQKVSSVRQEVEILSTNLAIISEAKSPGPIVRPQMERLLADTDKLSLSLAGLCDDLTSSLKALGTSGRKVNDVFLKTTTHFKKAAKQLIGWSSIHLKTSRIAKDLGDKIELVRPSAAVMGEDLQKLSNACTHDLSDRKELADLMSLASQANSTIVKTTDELLAELEQINVYGSRPDITAELAQQQIELRRALTELNKLADSGGIDTLSEEARIILDDIETMASSARDKILKTISSAKAQKESLEKPSEESEKNVAAENKHEPSREQ